MLAIPFAMPAMASAGASGPPEGSAQSGSPFDRQGMWVWYVSRSDGGEAARMIARADRAGIGTVYIKAGDGGARWSQFSSSLVEALHAGGLDVCAWQYVYGTRPLAEARVGGAAVRHGADCLAIDAESSYEGRYAAAERYVRALRARIGESFPVSLAGFPYVDYHPAFPYSVFLGPGGADYVQPQMYWKAIGTSVRAVYEHTYLFNRLWGRPIYPLGQTWERPGRRSILRFRRFAQSYGGAPPSWWDWQETAPAGWRALGASVGGPIAGYLPVVSRPVLKRHSRGDLVVWAQEHLRAAGQATVPVNGAFDRATYEGVAAFQGASGLPVDGTIGEATWQALLAYEPLSPRWAGSRARRGGAAASRGGGGTAGRMGGATDERAVPPHRPLSASLPARAYEIPRRP
ncbi:MAG TPA: peptidoglycan-binding domain-containing protein [Solirubrobacterales bacterium]|nr:peptidoglycan-binding domain-containing protein [Solirubrobacterales bacterium]